MKYDTIPEEFDEDYYSVESLKGVKENKMKRFFTWFVTSSVNRDRIALTLKAGVPFFVLLGISDTETLEYLTGSVGVVLANLAELITGIVTIIGLIRKIWMSFEK